MENEGKVEQNNNQEQNTDNKQIANNQLKQPANNASQENDPLGKKPKGGFKFNIYWVYGILILGLIALTYDSKIIMGVIIPCADFQSNLRQIDCRYRYRKVSQRVAD